MLVLARKVGQQIIIGDNIEVTVLEVRGEQVRLGINAPRTIAVHRSELLKQVAEQNLLSASSDSEVIASVGEAIAEKATPPQPPADPAPPETPESSS